MSVRARVAGSGAAVVAIYIALAAVSGHLSPFARRPLLDGYAPPPPYRWVKPPPSLASTNKPPLSGRFSIAFADGKSGAGVFRTTDSQAVLIAPAGAFPATSGARSITLTLTPVAPDGFGPPPSGLSIAGNVYRIRATSQPGGSPVLRLANDQTELAMTYPLTTATQHTLLFSVDGRSWTKIPASDSLAQHQILATHLTSLGSFAVAVPTGASPTGSTSSGGLGGVLTAIIAAVAAIILLLALRAEFIRRRNARGERSSRGPPRHRR